PDEMSYLNNVLQLSNYPHNQTQRGNFDVTKLSVPPLVSTRALAARQAEIVERSQSGALVLDAMQVRLPMFDGAIGRAMTERMRARVSSDEPGTPQKNPNPETSLVRQVRMVRAEVRAADPAIAPDDYDAAVQGAAADFAAAVLPARPGRSAEEYRSEWKQA